MKRRATHLLVQDEEESNSLIRPKMKWRAPITPSHDCGAHNAVLAGLRIPLESRGTGILEWSMETVRMFQEKDPILKRLLQLVPKGIKPIRPEISLENREMRRFLAQWTELEVQKGVVYRWKINASGRRVKQVVIPSGMRRDIMYYCHGHFNQWTLRKETFFGTLESEVLLARNEHGFITLDSHLSRLL